ncbi:MAG: NAD(P)/FAD-dependent oxidoreductase, partial [Candidatus Omnitrophica bacterium]|nr:NAD(P)/FAD-dependent oxidoreductase [Candidatus Omnitrophota bacterium]
MNDKLKNEYDVIIIGAGISGLVCGCYLAKSGIKTLIVEKNAKPGGCCVSFKRKDFSFDACVYSLSSFQKKGILNRIFSDFELSSILSIKEYNIPDIVITPSFKIKLNRNINETILEFCNVFPGEKSVIKEFFDLIYYSDVSHLAKLRNMTFQSLLDSYFTNAALKTAISILLLGYTSLPPSKLSSFVASLVYKEFVFDGGYYPVGGMQRLPDILAEKFQELGGTLLLSKPVLKIKTDNKIVTKVLLADKEAISCTCTVIACDMHEAYLNLIGAKYIPSNILNKVKLGEPSLSAFLVYLGTNKALSNIEDLKSHTWLIKNNADDIEKIYSNLFKGIFDYAAITSSSAKNIGDTKNAKMKGSICLFVNMPFHKNDFWDEEKKNHIGNSLVEIATQYFPALNNNIELKFSASPSTLFRWTSNFNGAAYGWASTVSQFGDPDFSEKLFLDNLYLAGHWANRGGGITSVANSGYQTA